jgi:hypothetical protein
MVEDEISGGSVAEMARADSELRGVAELTMVGEHMVIWPKVAKALGLLISESL